MHSEQCGRYCTVVQYEGCGQQGYERQLELELRPRAGGDPAASPSVISYVPSMHSIAAALEEKKEEAFASLASLRLVE